MWFLILVIVVSVLLLILGYCWLTSGNRWTDLKLAKRKYFYKEQMCEATKVSDFVAEVVQQMKQVKGAEEVLTQKRDKDKGYGCELAVVYEDSPRMVVKHGKCRLCVGMLFASDVDSSSFDAPLTSLGYHGKVIAYTNGLSMVMDNISHGLQGYTCQGLRMYQQFDRFLARNRDIRESLDRGEPDEIQFAEIVNPTVVVFYRPTFREQEYRLSSLPPLHELDNKKAQ